MALHEAGNRPPLQLDRRRALSPKRRVTGALLTAVGVGAQLVWLSWRTLTLPGNPVAVAVLLAELAGVAVTITIAIGLARSRSAREVFVDERRESHRFAFAVADLVGRTRASDVHREVRRAVREVQHRRPRRSAEAAMGAVLLEGPRRLVLVVALTGGLLLGFAPMGLPPIWATLSLVLGVGSGAAAHVVLGVGRIRFGDRLRWSYASIGEVIGTVDRDGEAPRRWVGTVASVAAVNLAIALRGMSDRWTHGLDPMGRDERTAAMLCAIVIVGGALYTIATTQAPTLDDARRARRLEERGARQSALGATVAVGLIGLFAGILPGGVDAADDHPARIEQTVDGEVRTPDE